MVSGWRLSCQWWRYVHRIQFLVVCIIGVLNLLDVVRHNLLLGLLAGKYFVYVHCLKVEPDRVSGG